MALLIGGCPKRQTTPRVIYIPSPPSASAPAPQEAGGTLVIEEPSPPPEPQEVPSEKSSAPRPTRRPRRVIRTAPDTTEVIPEIIEAPPAEVPALEPRESPEQETALRNQALAMQRDLEQRMARLNRAGLSGAELKILEGARTFLAQSGRALEEGDLQRALNLARKASLLVAALEQH